ncbi:alpha-L-fucosidase C-terminal domain-containing protein [Proteiniphilum sp. UBA5480]|uniref:alpha-L-fucosidase C-terminal domain-containing protein n=1 Tax=Proteiniphilum sp. UBA5480 TaxID=1947282 RepID=UPI0039C9398A
MLTGLKSAGKVELLGYKGALNAKQQQGKLTITLPSLTIDELPSKHAWVIKVSDFRE